MGRTSVWEERRVAGRDAQLRDGATGGKGLLVSVARLGRLELLS